MSNINFLYDSILDMGIFSVLAFYTNYVLRPNGGKWYNRLPLFLTYGVQSALYIVLYKTGNTASPPSIIDLSSWFCRMFIVALLYEGPWRRNIAVYALFSFSNTFIRLLTSQILQILYGHHNPLMYVTTESMHIFGFVFIIFIAASVISVAFIKKYVVHFLEIKSFARTTALLCSAINVTHFILIPIVTSFRYTVSPESVSILFIGLLSAVVLVIIATLTAFHEKSQRMRVLDQNAMLQSQLELQYQHFLEMEKADTELHKLRHDIANHMLVLKDMLSEGSSGAPAEYVEKLTERYESATTAMICRNFVFNAILNKQREVCNANNIEFHFQIDVPPTMEISDIDLMGVLSNMLSNAVNASLQVPEGKRRYVYISARLSADVLAVAIENSCPLPGEVPEKPNDGERRHGWGIKIIKEAVEKYDGVFKFQIICGKAFTSATMMNRKM